MLVFHRDHVIVSDIDHRHIGSHGQVLAHFELGQTPLGAVFALQTHQSGWGWGLLHGLADWLWSLLLGSSCRLCTLFGPIFLTL